ncbi:MAG TPA: phosphatase PAP2 family protein, partial [Armatimonadota bacterium]|nr:phosphatase PAP2 family protein [Armatimonadota bacterium]
CVEDASFVRTREPDDDFHWGRVRPLRDLGWAALGWIAIANDARMVHAIRSQLSQDVRHSAPVDALNLISEGYVTIPAALAATLFGEGELHDTGKLALSGILLTAATVDSLKTLTGRARPDGAGGVGSFGGPFAGGDSFPSGQTAAMFSLATVIGKRHPKAKWWAYALATGTAISRVFLDRHHPSDVLFGALVGIETGNFVLRNDGWLTRISIKF